MIDLVLGSQLSLHSTTKAWAEDIMNVGVREDIDVEELLDCEGREDFLELRSLERTIENFEKGEYQLNGY